MLSLTLFGGNRIDASVLEPGERLVCLVFLGGLEVDFTGCTEPPLQEIVVVSLLGGVNLKVRPEQAVRLEGFSVLGGRNVEPRRLAAPTSSALDDLPLEISAYSLFGGINVKRKS